MVTSVAGKLDPKTIQPVIENYNRFFDQFKGRFVKRDTSIDLMRYAIGMNQHVLNFGPPGTAKTKLCDMVFSGITGATMFEVEMTAFMTEDALFGPYDVRAMRDEGVLEHRIDGMLPTAQFARIGEMLDANMAVLRTLLGALNERRFRRGKQVTAMPLMTAYCDTNVPPGEYLRQNPRAFAVLDRILFMDRFDYLETPDDVSEMVLRFQRGITSQAPTELPIEGIKLINDLVTMPPGLITDPRLAQTYADIVVEYRTRRNAMSDEDKAGFILPMISDRRVNLASQMLELSAVLDCRLEAGAQDLVRAGMVLCTSDPERKLWEEIVDDHAKKYEATRIASIEDTQMIALRAIAEQIQRDVIDATDIPTAAHTWKVLSQQLSQVTPDNDVVREEKQKALAKLEEAKASLEKRALTDLGLNGNGG